MTRIILIIAFFVLTACQDANTDISDFQLITQKNGKIIFNSPPSDAKIYLFEECEAAGAIVTFFHNGCANYCSAIEIPQPPLCTTALTKSCLCPENLCYDKENNICRRPRSYQ